MKDAFDNIQQAFAEALVEASDNFRAAEGQKNTTEDGGVGETKDSIRRAQKMTLKDQLSEYYSNKFKQSDSFYFGITPSTLSRSGLDAHPLAFGQDDFAKSTRKKHNIPRRVLNKLSENLANPIFSFTAGKQAAVVINDIDGDGKPVVVAIHGGHTMDRKPVNLIKSIYGINFMGEWVSQQIAGGSNFRVYDIEKANALLQTQGYLAAVGATSDGSWDKITEKKPSVNSESAEALDIEVDAKTGSVAPAVLKSERHSQFEEDKYFARQIDKFGELKEGSYVTVGKIIAGSPIEKVGIPAGKLYFDVSKIRQEMVGRKDPVSPETIKGIPKVLDNPMLITEFTNKDGTSSINVYGKLYIGSSPVVIGIMIGKHRNGQSVDKIQTVHPNRNFMEEVTDSNTLYLGENKKETNAWFQALGAQEPPLGGTKYGFIRRISQPDRIVKHSERGDGTSNRSLLANAFEGITKDSIEYRMIQDYKSRVAELNELEAKLSNLNAEIRKIRFGTTDLRDTQRLTQLEEDAKEVAGEINRYDKRLLNTEDQLESGGQGGRETHK